MSQTRGGVMAENMKMLTETKDTLLERIQKALDAANHVIYRETDNRIQAIMTARLVALAELHHSVRNQAFECDAFSSSIDHYVDVFDAIMSGETESISDMFNGMPSKARYALLTDKERAKLNRRKLSQEDLERLLPKPREIQPNCSERQLSDGAVIRDQHYTRDENAFMGFGPCVIQPGNQVQISSTPQIHFKPRRLAIEPSVAHGLMLTDAKIESFSFFVNATPISASFFPPLPSERDYETIEELETAAKLTRLNWEPCAIGQAITLSILNMTLHAVTFTAVLWGSIVEHITEKYPHSDFVNPMREEARYAQQALHTPQAEYEKQLWSEREKQRREAENSAAAAEHARLIATGGFR